MKALDSLTVERLEELAVEEDLYNFSPTQEELNSLARIALAAKRAEPVAWEEDVLVMPDGLHRDTKALVLVFASAMAVKLHKAEQKYGYSNMWMQDDWQDKCLNDFNHHITKGDPLDVANYCAFMHYHGWGTSK
ncbi:TPA: hypothetical protein PXP81_000708 [Yersinia enterocolitica]|nr:hypothetical protein [Yersinia enterocolitica]